MTISMMLVLVPLLLFYLVPEVRAVSPLGYCGLGRYDVNEETVLRAGLDPTKAEDLIKFQLEHVPQIYRRFLEAQSVHDNNSRSSAVAGPPITEQIFLERAKVINNALIPVNLRVIYDSSLEAQFPERQTLEDYVRNLIFSAQLILEQPEFYSRVKFSFVVVSLEKLQNEFPIQFAGDAMLANIERVNAATNNQNADITIMLFYRSIFLHQDKHKGNRLLGLATSAAFCNKGRQHRGLILNAFALNNAFTLAHEFGHSTGIMHDSDKAGPERDCPINQFIMGPYAEPGKVFWSTCSSEAALRYLTSESIYQCIYDPNRLARSIPINDKFNFNGANRGPYPGEVYGKEKQCQLASDYIAKPSTADPKFIPKYEECQALICQIEHDHTYIGPALYGSNCKLPFKDAIGKCIYSRCVG